MNKDQMLLILILKHGSRNNVYRAWICAPTTLSTEERDFVTANLDEYSK